ncbi:hypothetical protein [Kineococcus sp. SYSU DK005]|uniref:hypothetical protein n=1 Tax=Kineococcus sp. SYSU DK005 TaxID=3383126 RepID=UPI003D7E568C
MIAPQDVPEPAEVLWNRALLAAFTGRRLEEERWRTRARAAGVRQRSELVRLESVAARLGVPAPAPPTGA